MSIKPILYQDLSNLKSSRGVPCRRSALCPFFKVREVRSITACSGDCSGGSGPECLFRCRTRAGMGLTTPPSRPVPNMRGNLEWLRPARLSLPGSICYPDAGDIWKCTAKLFRRSWNEQLGFNVGKKLSDGRLECPIQDGVL